MLPYGDLPGREPADRDHLHKDPLDRDSLDRDPAWTETPLWTENPLVRHTHWTETFWTDNPLDRDSPDTDPSWTETPWTETHPPLGQRLPPVNGMTHRCKKHYLPVTLLRAVSKDKLEVIRCHVTDTGFARLGGATLNRSFW